MGLGSGLLPVIICDLQTTYSFINMEKVEREGDKGGFS